MRLVFVSISAFLILLSVLPPPALAQGDRPVLRPEDSPARMRLLYTPSWFSAGDHIPEPRGQTPPPQVPPRQIVRPGLFEIGRTANTLSMLVDNRNPIAHDPKTKQLMSAFRGTDRSVDGDGRSLFVRYARRHGTEWDATGPDHAGGAIVGYPSVFLPHADNQSWAHAVMYWSRHVTFPNGIAGFGSIDFMFGGIGHPTVAIGTMPEPPAWSVPMEIRMDQQTGDLYSTALGLEPGNGALTGEYYLLRSTDGGQRWGPVTFDAPVWTSDLTPSGYQARNLRFDVSPDGSRLVLAWMNLYTGGGDSARVLDDRHEVSYHISTDRGLTWSRSMRIRLADLAGRPSPFEKRIAITRDMDVVFDYQNRLHFLLVCSADTDPFDPFSESAPDGTVPPSPVDSTFATELVVDGAVSRLLPIGPVRRVRTERRSCILAGKDTSYFSMGNETKWARNYAGTVLFAKWISPRATWLPTVNNGQTVLFPDTLTQLYVNARHADTTDGFPWYHRWDFGYPAENSPELDRQMRVTDLDDIGVKGSQLARYAGDGGQMHLLFVEWGNLPRPDSDPFRSEQILWYVQGVTLPVLDTEHADMRASSAVAGEITVAPNPSTASARISYSLLRSTRVRLTVHDALGRVVVTLVEEMRERGGHTAVFDGAGLPAGVYRVVLESDGRSMTVPLVHLR